jgi:hypothetical protein
MGGVNGVNVAIEMGGGQLTPTKMLGRVAVIDVVEVSCAQHAAAPVAPLRIQGSAHNYRPAKPPQHEQAHERASASAEQACALTLAVLAALCATLPRPADPAVQRRLRR